MNLEMRPFKLSYNSKQKEFSLAIQKKEFSLFGSQKSSVIIPHRFFYVGYQLYVQA